MVCCHSASREATQISWPLTASRVFQGVCSYCLRSSVSDLENAITTSSAPTDQGTRTADRLLALAASRTRQEGCRNPPPVPLPPVMWHLLNTKCFPRVCPAAWPAESQQPRHREAGGSSEAHSRLHG